MNHGSRWTPAIFAIVIGSSLGIVLDLGATEHNVAESTPAFRDPLTRDPMTAKALSRLSTGMGHYYNGNFQKMRKYQRLKTLAMIPLVLGLILDVRRDALKGVDQFKDLSTRRFPWWTMAGWWITGGTLQWISQMDQNEAYQDAFEGGSPLSP